MSYFSSASCVTCEARNRKCDGTRGSSGCRRCVQAGVICGGYSSASFRITKPKHHIRQNESQDSSANLVPNKSPATMTSSTDPLVPYDASRSMGNAFADPTTRNDDYQSSSVIASTSQYDRHTGYSSVTHGHNTIGHLPAPPPIPSTSQHIAALAGDVLSPSIEGSTDTRPFPPAGGLMVVPSQENSSSSLFNPTQSEPIAPLTSESLDHSRLRATPHPEWPTSYLDDEPEPEDSENIEAGLLEGLSLDRQTESNTLPFIVHCFAAWMIRFTFEPTRILPIIINHIRRGYAIGEETRQTMLLVSGSGLAISGSTDYDLTDFNALQKQLMDRVIETRARGDAELTNELALATMEYSHQFISTLFKVGSLASVLHVMGLYAPIFRRACPEPSDGFVNLPRRLTAMEIQLKYYSTLDVLQSVITNRPMFFRYDLDYLSPQEEALIKSDYGPGLRWLYGVPDRLMITLARMNTLFEDYGNRLDPERAQEIEKEIADCGLVVNTSHGINPTLNIGRATVQQSWKMAATVYLYMGLCGADSKDVRVAKVRKKFIKLLRGIKPSRNPDSFLVLPILIVGVATTSSAGQSTLLSRLWGISECTRPGTVGNDIVRILNVIWASTMGRPTVWADLRTACSRVTGM